METVRAALEDRDVLLFVADCLDAVSDQDRQAVELLRGVQSPVLLVLNKIDRLNDKRQLMRTASV